MKAATGEYINLYTEVGHDDDTDLKHDKLDIFILFCEADAGCLDMIEMEERARNAIKAWMDAYYTPNYGHMSPRDVAPHRFIPEKVKKILEEEFEEAVLIVVNEIF